MKTRVITPLMHNERERERDAILQWLYKHVLQY